MGSAAPWAAAAIEAMIIRNQSKGFAYANNLKNGTAAGGDSISSLSSMGVSSSTGIASFPTSKYGDGDSGGSETSETGVNGWTWGGDHPNKPLGNIIF